MCFSDYLYSLLQIFSYINFNLSIHAPAKGATMGRQCVLYITRISIHAPAKGATSHVVKISLSITYFNPRSREGSDDGGFISMRIMCKFQSTLPRRERRHRLPVEQKQKLHFNPRSREGSDGALNLRRSASWGFQSTLPRRERQ